MSETPYLRLIQAASQVVFDDDYYDLIDSDDIETLRREVEHNQEALALARTHLGPNCRIHLVYEANFFADNSPNMQRLRDLARAFAIEGRLAGFEKRWADVASIGLDLLDLAGATGRGGLLCDHMVGWAISGSGIDLLRQWRSEYDEATLSHLLVRIAQLESERDDWNEVLQRDQHWEETVQYPEEPIDPSTYELPEEEAKKMSQEEISQYYELVEMVIEMANYQSKLPYSERSNSYTELENRTVAQYRLMTLDTAIRKYRWMTGSYPRQLAELIPGALPALPPDPFTGTDFIYRPQWQGIFRRSIQSFLLYSPGPRQIDHGGSFGPYPLVAAGEADLCLDEFDYFPDD
ncbi:MULTISPECIES: hypothetical protein [Pirellulaceae]|uniref:hypothetical protein n=1 Tax=Pirellulaceae TaxID=2691357 RepID=UPI0011B06E80|nr:MULTISPECIES: hypothetical protein [Pirellulaceae]